MKDHVRWARLDETKFGTVNEGPGRDGRFTVLMAA